MRAGRELLWAADPHREHCSMVPLVNCSRPRTCNLVVALASAARAQLVFHRTCASRSFERIWICCIERPSTLSSSPCVSKKRLSETAKNSSGAGDALRSGRAQLTNRPCLRTRRCDLVVVHEQPFASLWILGGTVSLISHGRAPTRAPTGQRAAADHTTQDRRRQSSAAGRARVTQSSEGGEREAADGPTRSHC